MHVPREMQIDLFLGSNGSKAAARRAALDAKHGTEARLAKAKHRFLADLPKAFREGDGCRGFPFSRLRGGDGGHEDELAFRLLALLTQKGSRDFGLVFAIGLESILGDAGGFRDFLNGF